MARYTFGAGSGDTVVQAPTPVAPVLRPILNANATGTFWSSQTGGTQYTDLLDAATGSAISGLSTDQTGAVRQFKGPDGVMAGWIDFGSGRRFIIAFDGVFTAGDSAVAGYIGTAGSQSQTATDARYVKHGDFVSSNVLPDTDGVPYYDPSNPAVIQPTTQVNVRQYGAVGDGSTLDTSAINQAIQANPGREITVPVGPLGQKTYLVNPTASTAPNGQPVGIQLNQPGVRLKLEPGVSIVAAASGSAHYSIVQVSAADCSIDGGTIKGDVSSHTGGTGEWGFGVEVASGGDRFTMLRTVVRECWGDGVYLGGGNDVRLIGVISDSNRRQGCSIVAGTRPQILGGAYINTGKISGTAPQAGIDVEPNSTGGDVIDFVISGAVCSGNVGVGVQVVSVSGRTVTGTVTGCMLDGNSYGFEGTGSGGTVDVNTAGNHALNNTSGRFVTVLAGVRGQYAQTQSLTLPTGWTGTLNMWDRGSDYVLNANVSSPSTPISNTNTVLATLPVGPAGARYGIAHDRTSGTPFDIQVNPDGTINVLNLTTAGVEVLIFSMTVAK